jgi:O-antigen/teichoic acid export membrane protein
VTGPSAAAPAPAPERAATETESKAAEDAAATPAEPRAAQGAAAQGKPAAAQGKSRDIGGLARSGSLGLAGLIVSGLFQLLLVVAVTRGLGPVAAGLFIEAVALFVILSRIGELGAATGLVRTVSRCCALGRTREVRVILHVAIWPVVVVGVALAGATYLLADPLASVFFDASHQAEAARLIRLLAPVVPLAATSTVVLAATRGFGSMVPYVVVQNIALPAARLALVLGAVVMGLGSVAAGVAWGLPMAVAALASALALARPLRRIERHDSLSALDSAQSSYRLTPRKAAQPASALAGEFWRFAGPRGLAGIFAIAVTWLDVLLVGALSSTREAAIYAAASRLAIVGAHALEALGMAMAPRISGLLARDKGERVQALYSVATSWLVALLWPFYLTVAVFSPWVMSIFGPEFAAGHTALTVLGLAMLVRLATGNVTTVLLMGGKSSWSLLNASLSLITNVTLNLILTPRMGLTGAAIAWAASLTLVSVAPLIQVRLFLGLRPPGGGGFLVAALASLLCFGGLGMAVRHGPGVSAATFTAFAVVAPALYAAVLWRFRELLHFSELRASLPLGGRRSARANRPRGIRAHEAEGIEPAGASRTGRAGRDWARRVVRDPITVGLLIAAVSVSLASIAIASLDYVF